MMAHLIRILADRFIGPRGWKYMLQDTRTYIRTSARDRIAMKYGGMDLN